MTCGTGGLGLDGIIRTIGLLLTAVPTFIGGSLTVYRGLAIRDRRRRADLLLSAESPSTVLALPRSGRVRIRGTLTNMWPLTVSDGTGCGIITGPFSVVRDRMARGRDTHSPDVRLGDTVDVDAQVNTLSPATHAYREAPSQSIVELNDAVIFVDPERMPPQPSSIVHNILGGTLLAACAASVILLFS